MTGAPAVTRDSVVAAGVALVCAVGFGLVLSFASTPKDFASRVAALSTQVDRIERAEGSSRPPYRPGAVCDLPAAEEAKGLQAALGTSSAGLGLQLVSSEVTPEPTESSGGAGLIPVAVRFTAVGPYDGALRLLDQLSRGRPELFADTMDLTSNMSSVELKFAGRVYCAGRS